MRPFKEDLRAERLRRLAAMCAATPIPVLEPGPLTQAIPFHWMSGGYRLTGAG